jgi:hypothetical protein
MQPREQSATCHQYWLVQQCTYSKDRWNCTGVDLSLYCGDFVFVLYPTLFACSIVCVISYFISNLFINFMNLYEKYKW